MNEIIVDNQSIENKIYTIRGFQVMIDRDLADLYEVQTKRLNEQVKSFRFQLTEIEKKELVADCDRFKTLKHSTSLPYAFTEAEIIEQYGSGIKRIQDACKLHGVQEAKFEEFVHGFRVTLYKKKIDGGVNVGVDVGVNDVYSYIKINQPVKANQIALSFKSVTQRTIERYLKQLKDEDKIEFNGSPKMGGYVII